MILQPIVENCFKHGFDQKLEKATIVITARGEHDDYLCISVQDNGVGVREDALEQLRRELADNESDGKPKSTGIGLKNIYDRLKIYYSSQVEMEVDGSEDGGFKITVIIPRDIKNEVVHP